MLRPVKNRIKESILEERTENLIAIGAATASNCIPCFEHIYEKAITSGITLDEIKRASDIAAMVKKGAHLALTNTVGELVGEETSAEPPCKQKENKPCGC